MKVRELDWPGRVGAILLLVVQIVFIGSVVIEILDSAGTKNAKPIESKKLKFIDYHEHVCKICGATIDEMIDEYKEASAALEAEGSERYN